MGRIIDAKPVTVRSSESILGFEERDWSRFLTIKGVRAYDLGAWCDTCGFLFQRLDGANTNISIDGLGARLAGGLHSLDESLVGLISKVLPVGEYVAVLVEIAPSLVSPGDSRDYFSHEQVQHWGISGFTGLPLYPATKYYRGNCRQLAENEEFYEFVAPMVPSNWLDEERVSEYRRAILDGVVPTALAVSFLDVRQHWNSRVSHWCLAHCLLDGHHKVYAASLEGKPLTLVAFVTVDHSICTVAQLWQLIRSLAGHTV